VRSQTCLTISHTACLAASSRSTSRPIEIRRGLNTTVDQDADDLVEQLQRLLADRKWWSADRRADAEREGLSPLILSAFFDGIEAGHLDTADIRERHIHLPTKEEGYSRVLPLAQASMATTQIGCAAGTAEPGRSTGQ
jgi:hypothetical protein